MPQTVELLDRDRRPVACAQVEQAATSLTGTVQLDRTPAAFLAVFNRFEQVVNEQTLGLLDGVEDEVAALGIRARLSDGRECDVDDLQIFPATGLLSFRLRPPSVIPIGR